MGTGRIELPSFGLEPNILPLDNIPNNLIKNKPFSVISIFPLKSINPFSLSLQRLYFNVLCARFSFLERYFIREYLLFLSKFLILKRMINLHEFDGVYLFVSFNCLVYPNKVKKTCFLHVYDKDLLREISDSLLCNIAFFLDFYGKSILKLFFR